MTTPLSDAEISEALRLDAAATKGPWTAENINESTGPYFKYVGNDVAYLDGWEVRGPDTLGNHELSAFTEADGIFIARARDLLPRAVAEVVSLRSELAAARAVIAEADKAIVNAYLSSARDGWQEGPTSNECADQCLNYIKNHGLESAMNKSEAALKGSPNENAR